MMHSSLFFIGCVLALFAASPALAESDSKTLSVYVGTYTGPKSKGIYLMQMDRETGALSEPKLAAEVPNPSFLAIHPMQRFLYAVSEAEGQVTAFSIANEGMLAKLNQQPSGGSGPCYISLDPTGKMAMVANYGSGSFESLPIEADGKLGSPASKIQDSGKGPDAARQEGPHGHSINSDPAGRFAFAADLGLDTLFGFRLDPANATLTPNDPPSVKIAPGAGPRHLAFHPSGKFAYLVGEMASTVTAFSYNAHHGVMTELQTITTLPPDFHGSTTSAEVQVHPSGKFVYASNRGHDSIAVYRVDTGSGKLTSSQIAPCLGKTPRGFRIDPSGRFLLCAHQDSSSIVVFKIDPETGALTPTDHKVNIGSPVCIQFLPESARHCFFARRSVYEITPRYTPSSHAGRRGHRSRASLWMEQWPARADRRR
jgi:6-phosphogluconolactonase